MKHGNKGIAEFCKLEYDEGSLIIPRGWSTVDTVKLAVSTHCQTIVLDDCTPQHGGIDTCLLLYWSVCTVDGGHNPHNFLVEFVNKFWRICSHRQW